MAQPVVTIASGGMPVVDVTATKPLLGAPVTEATNGYGIPVTKVIGKPGMPVTFVAATLQQTGLPPAPLTASVTSTSPAPTEITVVFSSTLQASPLPAASDFLITRNFVGRAPSTVAISGVNLKLTMDADYGDPGN